MKKQSDLIEEYFENNLNVYCKNITAINNFSDVTFMITIEKYNMQLIIPKIKIDEITIFANHIRIKFYKVF
jgi:hypothetical protein